MDKWISVEDELPETGFLPITTQSKSVLIWIDSGKDSQDIELGYWSEYDGWNIENALIDAPIINVTHWQPLPPPPKDKQ